MRLADPAAEYLRQTYTREHGLPDNDVRALAQTQDGYLWVGTRAGLARFDGLKWTVFSHANTPLMTSDTLVALASGYDGSLWAATSAELLHRHQDGSCTRYTTREGLCDAHIMSLCPSHFGGIWVGTERGLNRVEGNQVRQFTVRDGLHGDRIRGLFEDADGTVLVGTVPDAVLTDCNLQWRSRNGGGFSKLVAHPTGADTIVRDGRGTLWIQEQGRLYGVGKEGSRITAERALPPMPVNLILADRGGSVWLSAGSLGLDRFNQGQFTRCALSSHTNNITRCMIEDREGNLWIGASQDGLHCWRPRKLGTYTTNDGLAHNNVWAICEGRDRSVWLGTDAGVSHWINGRFVNYGQTEGLAKNTVRALAEDRAGTLWVGTGNGLDAFQAGVFRHHRFHGGDPVSDPDEIAMNKIRVILVARDESMWLGLPLGLKRLQGTHETFCSLKDGLPGADVRALMEARDGSLWVGTAGGGVAQFTFMGSGSNGVAEADSLTPTRHHSIRCFTATNGLSSNYAWAFYEDADGALWIGTDKGLNRFKHGRFAAVTTRQGLFDDLVKSIIDDDLGNFWIGCDRGIYRVSRGQLSEVADGKMASLQCTALDEADGLLSLETNGQKSQPPACKTRDGRLWFGTTHGVVVIDPRRLGREEVPPLLVIEQLRANGQVVFSNLSPNESQPQSRSSLGDESPATNDEGPDPSPPRTEAPTLLARFGNQKSKIANQKSETILPPGSAHVLEVCYTANTFVAAKDARFRYRLVGLDSHWIEADTRRVAYFAGLRPGRYRFEVTASNHHGAWSEQPATLALYLAPHFYETWGFYVLCGAAVGGAGTWRWRRWQKVQQLEKANALARQRERIARDLHDGLSSSATEIGLLTQQALRALAQPQQAASHLQHVAAIADEISQALGDIAWAIDQQDTTLGSFLAHLRRFVSEYLEAMQVHAEWVWPNEIPATPISPELRYHLFLVVKEALSNVAKHARATCVSVLVALCDSNLSIRLTDNGRGFDPVAQTTGYGLTNMRQRVLDLGGQLKLHTQPGQGTTLLLQVPLHAPA